MTILVVAIFFALLLLNIWVLLIRPARPWTEKFGTVLQILALYTFGFGVISQTKLLPAETLEELTSPDLFAFLGGNATAWSMVSLATSMALDPEKTSFGAFAFLELFGNLVLGLVGMAAVLVYALVVAPLAYVAYVVVSLPVSGILTAGTELGLVIDGETFDIKEVVADNVVLIRNLLIAFVSIAMRTSLELATSIRKTRRDVGDEQRSARVHWQTRHPGVARAFRFGSQGVLVLVLFTLIVSALVLPFIDTDPGDPPVPTGELIGAEMVTALVLWSLVVVLLKTRRRWKLMSQPTPEVEVAGP